MQWHMPEKQTDLAHAAAAACSGGCIDVSNMEIILRGKQWDRAEDPSHSNAIHLLERNESLVTWLQPKASVCTCVRA
jgi:vacuolar-type H+-ATPase subunit C/Vma6